ncbi:hypothetical protein ACK3TF_002489 [Chlorella vulgaris]
MGAASSAEAIQPSGVITLGEASAPQQGDDAFLRQLAHLRHSLPILPNSTAEPGTLWSRSLSLARGSASAELLSSSASGVGAHLDPEPLKRLVEDYQRFTRWHCRRIVEQQDKLNGMLPQVEQRAAQLHAGLAESCRQAVAAQASMAAVAHVQRELQDLTARLERVQHTLAEVERLAAAHQRQQHVGSDGDVAAGDPPASPVAEGS